MRAFDSSVSLINNNVSIDPWVTLVDSPEPGIRLGLGDWTLGLGKSLSDEVRQKTAAAKAAGQEVTALKLKELDLAVTKNGTHVVRPKEGDRRAFVRLSVHGEFALTGQGFVETWDGRHVGRSYAPFPPKVGEVELVQELVRVTSQDEQGRPLVFAFFTLEPGAGFRVQPPKGKGLGLVWNGREFFCHGGPKK